MVKLDGQKAGLRDFDARTSSRAPSAIQRAAAKKLGVKVRWNKFGTPASLSRQGGYVSTGIAGKTAGDAARRWINNHRALLGLAAGAQVVLLADNRLAASAGHAVTFVQRFGGLKTTNAGSVTVGITGSSAAKWKVAYVSSSLSRSKALAPGKVKLNRTQAWAKAAGALGVKSSARVVRSAKTQGGWTYLAVGKSAKPQQVRQVAFPMVKQVVPAYETLVLNVGEKVGYRTFVDARSGRILARYNLEENLADLNSLVQTFTFSGTMPATDGACGPFHGPYTVGPGVRALDGFAAAAITTNDVILKLFRGSAHQTQVLAADTLFSPESFHYEPTGGVPPDDYWVQVCDFPDGAVWAEPRTYDGTFTIDDSPAPAPYLARWKAFTSNPLLGTAQADPYNRPSTDIRKIWCWRDAPGCDRVVENLASRSPWDHNVRLDIPTHTTVGNNAHTAESWTNPSFPSPFQFQPTSATRDYSYPWTDAWNQADCNTALGFTPGVSWDVSAAVTNLFVQHNRMHDWQYYLGFTEKNWNAQDINFGLTEQRQQGDPLLGDTQAGAAIPTQTAFVAGSRNNANMFSLPDGVSSVTNMYLFQPDAASFYPPCADGDYDMSVIGHEYTHMTENRMIGKGNARTGHAAGAMGESVADLNAMEYQFENGFNPGSDTNVYVMGSYVTGNKVRGIRDYALDWPQSGDIPRPSQTPRINPLNFSDIGFDVTGPEVHADGEIWNVVNFTERALLMQKYKQNFPFSNAELQEECADNVQPVQDCPGNRRWIQLVLDSFLLMQPDPTMLDARDAQLAADLMRFGGVDQKEIWQGFAQRGFGVNAHATDFGPNGLDSDTDPVPDFQPAIGGSTHVKFVARDADTNAKIPARFYVGHYQGRVSPIADTDPATPGTGAPAFAVNLDDQASFVPGTYEFTANAPGYGIVRFRETFQGGSKTVTVRLAPNWASTSQGATATGDTSGANAAAQAAQLRNLIDDNEATNWTTA
ncbi:MAG TPA: M36 family metallopeptidase, partial [Gaiellaceae bacterium]